MSVETQERQLPRRKSKMDRDRLELRAEPEWIRRVTAVAERLGLGLSAYVRLCVNRQLEQDEAQAPAPTPKKGGKA